MYVGKLVDDKRNGYYEIIFEENNENLIVVKLFKGQSVDVSRGSYLKFENYYLHMFLNENRVLIQDLQDSKCSISVYVSNLPELRTKIMNVINDTK